MLSELRPDVTPFRREGTGFVYEPQGVNTLIRFTRIKGNDDPEAEIQIVWQGHHHIRRKVRLMASGTRGAVADLARELNDDIPGPDWRKILRDGCESTLNNYRRGPDLVIVEGGLEIARPIEWLCKGLLVKGKPNCWLGAGATGKSTFAKALCVHHALGFPFLDRQITRGVPLYCDWEDDHESFVRTCSEIARALGEDKLPRMGYLDMHGKRLSDNTDNIASYIDRHGITLAVFDAIASAGGAPGEHSTWESVAIGLEDSFGNLPRITLLGIDHVTGEEHRNGRVSVPIKARGAERKYEIFRNQWSLVADQEERAAGRHVVQWIHTKNNAGPYEAPFVVELEHTNDELHLTVGGVEMSPDAVERLGPQARVEYELNLRPEGILPKDLTLVAKKEDNAKNVKQTIQELHRLRRKGKARHDQATGLWFPIDGTNRALSAVPLPMR